MHSAAELGGGIDDGAQAIHHCLDARPHQLGDGTSTDNGGNRADDNIHLRFAGSQTADFRADYSADISSYGASCCIAVCAGDRTGEKHQRFGL